jgi:hypothetical protein
MIGKCWVLSLSVGIACGSLLIASAAVPDARTQGGLSLEVQHSPAMDLFVVMDSVSDWRPGWTQKEYQAFWTNRFGPPSRDDQEFLNEYAAFRRRTYHDPDESSSDTTAGTDGIFAKRSGLIAGVDPLAVHFRSRADPEAAIATLPADFGVNDGRMLQGFYAHFRPEWEQVLAGTENLDRAAKALQDQVTGPAVSSYLDHVQRFYGVAVDGTYPVYIVWWPSADSTAGKARGGALYLQINPADRSGTAELTGIVFHEVAHFVSAHVEQTRKQNLSKEYLKNCAISPNANYLAYLEEPLAVAVGNAGYAHFVLHQPLDLSKDWYFDPRSDLLAKLIWPDVRSDLQAGRRMPLETIVETATFCGRIRDAGRMM